jgi:hypothetical protein
MLQFAVGLYLGIGTGHAVSVLAEIGFGRALLSFGASRF